MACARGDLTKCSASSGDLTSLANLNSPDGVTDIDYVCGSTSPFTVCASPPSPLRLVDCTTLPTSLAGASWVEVRTKTRSNTAHPSVVGKLFGRTSDPSYTGTGVKACARAAWGPSGGLTTMIPVIFSMCEWRVGTVNGTTYGNKPPFTVANPMTPAREVAMALNAPNDAACALWAGHDLPGGFGWLCHGSGCTPPSTSSCLITVGGNGWVDVTTGVGGGNDCTSEINATLGKKIYLPIFDCISNNKQLVPCDNTANGTNTFYHVEGYAAFFVTGIDIGGSMNNNFLPGYPTAAAKTTCSAKGGKCIYGWFIQEFLPASAVIGGGSLDRGLMTVQAAG